MHPSSKKALAEHLAGRTFGSVLDVPSGGGWLQDALGEGVSIDGIDLYESAQPGYRNFWAHDLDTGLPKDCGPYDLICCCEGLEHVGSPLLLLRDFHRVLADDGLLVITTPNVWYPQARLQYLLRGFFPSFPSLAGKVVPGTHMHIMPWSFPQLYVYLRLAGFGMPAIITEPQSKAKHLHERFLAVPGRIYCRGRFKKAGSEEEREDWKTAGSDESLLSRHLMVVCRKLPAGGA